MFEQFVIVWLIVLSASCCCVVCVNCFPCAQFFGTVRYVSRNGSQFLGALFRTVIVLCVMLYVLLKTSQFALYTYNQF